MATKRLNVDGYAYQRNSYNNGAGNVILNTAEYFLAEASVKRQFQNSGAGRVASTVSAVIAFTNTIGEKERIRAKLDDEKLVFLRSNVSQGSNRLFGDGSALTGYSDTIGNALAQLRETGEMPRKIRKELNKCDFNSTEDRRKLVKHIKKMTSDDFAHYAKFTDHTNPDEIAVYLALSNQKNYVSTVKKLSKQIEGNKELKHALKGNHLHKYVFGRIATGQIDVEQIEKSGMLCGVALQKNDIEALKALRIFANADSITNSNQVQFLEECGVKSKHKNFDLNSLKAVRGRIHEFEKALSNVNVKAKFPFKKNISSLTAKEIGKLIKDGSAYGYLSAKEIRGLEEMKKLKEHAGTLMAKKNRFRRKMNTGLRAWRKLTHDDSDFMQGIMHIRSGVHTTKLAYKVSIKTAKISGKGLSKAGHAVNYVNKANVKMFKKMLTSKPAKAAYSKAKNFMMNHALKMYNGAKRTINGAKNAYEKGSKAASHLGNVLKENGKLAKESLKSAKEGAKKLKTAVKDKVDKITDKIPDIRKLKNHNAKKKAKKAQKKMLKVTKKPGIVRKAIKKVSGMFSVVKAFLMKMALWVVIGYIMIMALASGFRSLVGPIGTLEDKLFGWFDDIDWPWSVTEETKRNVFTATTYQIILEEAKYGSIEAGLQYEEDINKKAFFSGINLKDFTVKQFDISKMDSYQYDVKYISFEDAGAETYLPANRHSLVKLAISITYAVSFPVESWADCSNFAIYAVGEWHHLNETTISAVYSFPDDLDATYTFKCNKNKDKKYDKIYNYNNTEAVEDATEFTCSLKKISDDNKKGVQPASTHDYMFIKNGYIPRKTEKGCVSTKYNGYGTVTQIVNLGGEKLLPEVCETVNIKSKAKSDSIVFKTIDQNNTDGPLTNTIPINEVASDGSNTTSTLSYVLNPLIPQKCIDDKEFDSLFKATKANDSVVQDFRKYTKICGSSSHPMSDCNNKGTVYCDGCIHSIVYHSVGTVKLKDGSIIEHVSHEICGCNESMIVHTLYMCAGHPIMTYHGNSVVLADEDGKFHSHCGLKKQCDDAIATTNNGTTYYECPGHQTGTKYCSDAYMAKACKNCEESVWYECPGVGESYCHGHEVCLGHYDGCPRHYSCPGHTITYNTGKVSFTFTDKMHGVENESYWYTDWTFKTEGKFLWFDVVKTYKSKELQDDFGEFHGWEANDEEAKAYLSACLGSDWYSLYGISGREFEGSLLSYSEIDDIMEAFGITAKSIGDRRYKTVEYALKCVGEIPYYPGDNQFLYKAGYEVYQPNYSANHFGTLETPIFENEIQYSTHGLAKEALPDLIIWGGHEVKSGLNVDYIRTPKLAWGGLSNPFFGTKTINFAYLDEAMLCTYPNVLYDKHTAVPGDVVIQTITTKETLFGGITKENVKYCYNVGIFLGYLGEKKDKMLIVTMGTRWCELQVVSCAITSFSNGAVSSWRVVTGIY